MSLTPRGMSIQEAYRIYSSNRFLVNRRYQRKLVWSESEKKYLIDSIERNFPIPLFMLSAIEGDDGVFEVIDGMQRLNAIFSFIEHHFVDLDGKAFDVNEFSRAKIRRDDGVFAELNSNIDRLSDKACASFLEYQLAVTIDTEGSSERVNEVFGRINSTGRRLSPQEQRQAGVVSGLSEAVRTTAMELRGDDSKDILPLNHMPTISVNTPRERQGYGVDASDIFWCRHGIISPSDLAKSEDEQIVSDIIISLLNGVSLNASREVFDSYFDVSSKEYMEIERKLNAYGSERIRSEIIITVSNIRSVFETDQFMSIRNCVQKNPANTARTAFYALFMSFHDLINKQGRFPENFPVIIKALKGSQEALIMPAHYTKSEDRENNIAKITGLIQKFFVKKDVPVLHSAHSLIVDLENSLRRSKYESSRYEFKIGVCALDGRSQLDPGIYEKIARTACAIANGNPGQDGYIYLGVADKKSASIRIQDLFGTNPIEIGDVQFVGIGHDLTMLGIDLESYMRKLIAGIQATPIPEPIKTHIVTTVDHAEYIGRPFVRIRVPKQDQLTQFGDEYPIRKNSETVGMTTAEALAQSKLFR